MTGIKATPAAQKEQEARQAHELQSNPMFIRAMQEIEDEYTREWKTSPGPNSDYRERAYYMVQAVDRLRRHLSDYEVTGKLEVAKVRKHLEDKK